MLDQSPNVSQPLRVAIIGAGPSAFYAAGSLIGQHEIPVTVDMFDRLPTPFGLVRYGVAPDHPKIKTVTKVYERIGNAPNFRFFGNVTFGRDLTHADLRRYYHAIIYAVGAPADRRLEIPGEDLAGSLSATAFVAWYNGHPDFADLAPDLTCNTAVVVGVGNVALDVARILARSPAELAPTDIATHAEKTLASSLIRDIHLLSRRGPAQARFTPAELKEFGELTMADVIIDAAELKLDPLSEDAIRSDSEAQRNLAVMRELAARPLSGKPRRVHFHFFVSPVEILGEAGHVSAVRIEQNELRAEPNGYLNAHGTGQFSTIPAGLILRAVGYRGVALADVPYDERHGIIPNVDGRVTSPASAEPISGEYVVGWAKRGATGVIGTNKPDAAETVDHLLADAPQLPAPPEPDPAAIVALLKGRKIPFVDMAQWRLIDEQETIEGQQQGKPRVKFVHIAEMLAPLADENR